MTDAANQIMISGTCKTTSTATSGTPEQSRAAASRHGAEDKSLSLPLSSGAEKKNLNVLRRSEVECIDSWQINAGCFPSQVGLKLKLSTVDD